MIFLETRGFAGDPKKFVSAATGLLMSLFRYALPRRRKKSTFSLSVIWFPCSVHRVLSSICTESGKLLCRGYISCSHSMRSLSFSVCVVWVWLQDSRKMSSRIVSGLLVGGFILLLVYLLFVLQR